MPCFSDILEQFQAFYMVAVLADLSSGRFILIIEDWVGD